LLASTALASDEYPGKCQYLLDQDFYDFSLYADRGEGFQ
jgi:hypothetical protein